jgi:hypothetical protein
LPLGRTQFLNRSSFVQHLVRHNSLLPTLAQCLHNSLAPVQQLPLFSIAAGATDIYPLVLKYR